MYQSAKFDVQMFDVEDVITTSGASDELVPPVWQPAPEPEEPEYVDED